MIRAWQAAALIASLVCLTGCATPPSQAAGEAPWTAGRLSLRVDASPARIAQSLSVAFEIRGSDDAGELRLTSPLGTQLASARWAPGVASLRTPDGERQFADLDDLSRQTLGETLPLAAMPAWLAGRPWSGAQYQAQPDGFEQLGWRVQTGRLAEGWISARRATAPAVQLRVKLDQPEP